MNNQSRNKRGSSRRKGDEFQDLSALRLVLELYSSGEEFQLFLEYEKAEAIDDIVIFMGQNIRAIQAKYAIDPLSVYVPNDFTDDSRRTYFGRYAEGWRKARGDHPGHNVTIDLLSNRSRDSDLEDIIGADGRFTPAFILGTMLKDAKKFREKLEEACAFKGVDAEKQFQEFLSIFQFQLGQRSLDDLRSYLEGEVLDHQFGISDRAVFHQLKELIERHAIELHEPITRAHLDDIFLSAQRRFLLPQVFPVDSKHFVPVPTFNNSLLDLLAKTDGDYVVVTGLPGSGKSTSLSEFFDGLETDERFETCRYLSFVSPNDDTGRLRLEAEALRVNLLSELHIRFRDLLDRRYDYCDRHLAEVLGDIGEALTAAGRKLVILIDGLDHAERDPLVRESLLRALPTSLPTGVVFVIGTQELKNWQPLALRKGRQDRHLPIPLFTRPQTQVFLVEKHGLALDAQSIERIHNKSQGLPLYLRYAAVWLKDHGGDPATLDEMPEAGDGDIRNYYDLLWANFDRDGMSQARYLCGVLSALRFPVRLDELPEFQTAIAQADIAPSVRTIAHLLREEDDHVSVFHDSFRVFVNSKLDDSTLKVIARDILAKLKGERGSSRWFTHFYRYALEAEDEAYVLAEVNRAFVDFALQHCRPPQDVFGAIDASAKAAVRRADLVTLARLGSLHCRTSERIEHQFDYSLLAKVQLSLGRVDDVLGFCCRHNGRGWLVEDHVAMEVMEWCAQTDNRTVGEKLFSIFRDTHQDKEWSDRHEIVALARVVAIYSQRHPAWFLRWLSSIKFRPDTLEYPDTFAPGFAPHLSSFLGAYVRYRKTDEWKRLKRMHRLFPNQLVRHMLLRLVFKFRPKELASELNDYLVSNPTVQNLEVAAYAAFAGFPIERVRAIAGPVVLPPRTNEDRGMVSLESDLISFDWSALVLGYEDDLAAVSRAEVHIGHSKTMYSGFLRFLLRAGLCLGRTAAGKTRDAFRDALDALDELVNAGIEDEPCEMETLRACRPMLPETLFRLTRHVAQECSDRLDAWCEKLLALRESEMWTSHWGISETTEDYMFELSVWERLSAVPGIPSRLLPILRSCATTYTEAKSLKAGSRCSHFLRLAAIAAHSGWRTDAEKWREKGTASSLTYGYHKDTTLDCLVDVLEMLNHYEPEHGLRRAAAILEMVKWMRAATDNRETEDFEQSVFRTVLQVSREAAFSLIRYYRNNSGRWKMVDCLEQYCTALECGDTEVLWTLKDAFTPHFIEQGRHPKQVTRAARHLRSLGQKNDASNGPIWQERYINFVRTHLDPSWWPDEVWQQVTTVEKRVPRHAKNPYTSSRVETRDEFVLDGHSASRSQIECLLAKSIESFCITVEKLCSENSYFYGSGMIDSALSHHISKAVFKEDAERLWEIARGNRDLFSAESLQAIAHRLFDVGKSDVGFECLLLAYKRSIEYSAGSRAGQPFLTELCQRDQKRFVAYLAECCGKSFGADYGGFDLPRMIARYYAAIGDHERLRSIFTDYLTHCEELFADFPKDEHYGWLRDYRESGANEAAEVVDFLIDLIGEPEIDQARRLVRVLANLAKTRSELVCHAVFHRFSSAKPLLRERLEPLLEALAVICAPLCAIYFEMLLPLLKEPHFRLRKTLVRVIRCVGKTCMLPATVTSAMEEAEQAYSPLIAYPSRRFLQVEPSPGFVRFLSRGLLFDLRNRMRGISDLLHIHPAVILSYIERALQESGWSEEVEEERLKSDWHGQARDHRVVWIVPQFHTQVSELLQIFVHQAVANGRFTPTTLFALENVLRPGDPEFIVELPHVKPVDIPALNVTDGAAWTNAITEPPLVVAEPLHTDGWTTVHEERLLSQPESSHPKFVCTLQVRSVLVTPSLANKPEAWAEELEWADGIPLFHPEESLTLEEARSRLMEAAELPVDFSDEILPLVSTHENGNMFHGLRWLAFVNPIWLRTHNLKLVGTQLIAGNQCIARLEEWQEGYEDDVFSRELLSMGMRLIIRNDWLNKILAESNRALVIRESECRRWHEDYWEKKPRAEASSIRYAVSVPSA